MQQMVDAARAVETVWGELLSAQHHGASSYVSLPLIYPSGSPVTVRVTPSGISSFKVSDDGFAYRELESFGGQSSFAKAADALLDARDVSRDTRCLFAAPVEADELARGISDVATASWQVVDKVYSRLSEDDEDEFADLLTERLMKIFGKPAVSPYAVLPGASTANWEMTALVIADGKRTAFQAVGHHPNSIYRTNSAFDDLAELDRPPSLVAVVKSKPALGPRLTLLARRGFVIEVDQPNTDYMQAAA